MLEFHFLAEELPRKTPLPTSETEAAILLLVDFEWDSKAYGAILRTKLDSLCD